MVDQIDKDRAEEWRAALDDGAPDLDATIEALAEDFHKHRREAVAPLEALRPHWAQGYTSDSIAAQTATAALSDMWEVLGVTDQTAAMAKLREAVSPPPAANIVEQRIRIGHVIAWEHYGIAWDMLEQVSRDEILAGIQMMLDFGRGAGHDFQAFDVQLKAVEDKAAETLWTGAGLVKGLRLYWNALRRGGGL